MTEPGSKRLAKPRLIRLSYLIWIPVLGVLWWSYASLGLPHLIWSYQYQLAGTHDRWDYAARRYTRCTFIGPTGPFTRQASNQRCPWIAFRRAPDAGGGR